VPGRLFTPQDANDALAVVRPLAEQLVELRRTWRAANAKRAELGAVVQGNGGGLGTSDFAELEAELEAVGSEIERCLAQLDEAGVQVKDLDTGLLDFPARHEGREILLCWHVGEERVAYWHGIDEGFAGRKPIEQVE
jgi:hypothetical protein